MKAGEGNGDTMSSNMGKYVTQGDVSDESTKKLYASKGTGHPLPKNTKSEMERGFGVNFSNVMIHTDSQATDLSKNLGAQAFTHGPDIYFNSGKFDTQSQEGKKLLAHELTHVVQQGYGPMRAHDREAALFASEQPKIHRPHLQKKDHERGCTCPGCTGKDSGTEKSTNKRSPLIQTKLSGSPLIQMKPADVVSTTFVGNGVGGGVHRTLKDRLKLVEAELQKQYDAIPVASRPATLKEYAGVNTIEGWQDRKNPSNHTTGRAVDINYANQPYIATRTTEAGKTTFGGEEGGATPATRALRRPAVEVYDRAASFTTYEGLVADVSNRKEGESATETYRRFKYTSDALAMYFSLVFKNTSGEVKRPPILDPETASETDLLSIPTSERLDEVTAIANITRFMDTFWWRLLHPNYPLTPREQFLRILRDYEIVRKPMQRGNPETRPGNTRNPAMGFLHLPEHFVVAMMDIGKLRWGACEFSAGSNGDVHHFDLTAPHHTPALTSGLASAPSKVLWKVDKASSPPRVNELDKQSFDSSQAHQNTILADGLYEMYAHPIVVSGDTYLKVYKKDGNSQFWPTNEHNLIEMPDDMGKKGGKEVLGGHITNYSPDDVESTEGDRFLSPEAAAAVINTVGRFRLSFRDAELGMGDASTQTGDSPRIEASKSKRHGTHYQGNAFDARYLNDQGQSERIDKGKFDTKANYDFIKTVIDEGFRTVIIGTNKIFNDLKKKLSALTPHYKGLKIIRESHHDDHMHLAFKASVPAEKTGETAKSKELETEYAPLLKIFKMDPEEMFVPSDSR